MADESALMEKMFDRMWHIVMMGTDRVLVANVPDDEAFVKRLCEKWFEFRTTRIIIIRVYTSSHGPVADRVVLLTYDESYSRLTSDGLREVGLVILMEDDMGLNNKIDRVMDDIRSSKMGDIPIVCVSHLPNPPARRKIARWFNHVVDGKALNGTTVARSPAVAECIVTSSPSFTAPSHPYYRNFAAASSAARRVLRGLEKTREQYDTERTKDPKLPPDPAKIYPDFERRGGWTMYLTGKPNEADR